MPEGNWLMWEMTSGRRMHFRIEMLGSPQEQNPAGIGSFDVGFLMPEAIYGTASTPDPRYQAQYQNIGVQGHSNAGLERK